MVYGCVLVYRLEFDELCNELGTPWIYKILFRATYEKYKEMKASEGYYFHYLVPEDIEEESSDEAWHGKLSAIEKTIKSEAGKYKKALGGRIITESKLLTTDSALFCRDQPENNG